MGQAGKGGRERPYYSLANECAPVAAQGGTAADGVSDGEQGVSDSEQGRWGEASKLTWSCSLSLSLLSAPTPEAAELMYLKLLIEERDRGRDTSFNVPERPCRLPGRRLPIALPGRSVPLLTSDSDGYPPLASASGPLLLSTSCQHTFGERGECSQAGHSRQATEAARLRPS